MELLDRETFLEWMEHIMKRFDDLKQTAPDIPPTSDDRRRTATG